MDIKQNLLLSIIKDIDTLWDTINDLVEKLKEKDEHDLYDEVINYFEHAFTDELYSAKCQIQSNLIDVIKLEKEIKEEYSDRLSKLESRVSDIESLSNKTKEEDLFCSDCGRKLTTKWEKENGTCEDDCL